MGMSIEQKIKTLLELYHFIKGDIHFCGYNKENATQSLETAIDTMRKYQKIAQILKDIPYGGDVTVRRIQEVVEDGTNEKNK